MNKRRTFRQEFKREAVHQLEQGHKSPNDIAINPGVRRNPLYRRILRFTLLVGEWDHKESKIKDLTLSSLVSEWNYQESYIKGPSLYRQFR